MKKTASIILGFILAALAISNSPFALRYTRAASTTCSAAWIDKAGMPTARRDCAAAAIDGKLYVVGGATRNAFVDTLEVYDPASDTWTAKRGMPTVRAFSAAAAIDGKLYVVGGVGDSGRLNTLVVYDPLTDAWTTKAEMPTARQYLGAVAIEGKLYAIGETAEGPPT